MDLYSDLTFIAVCSQKYLSRTPINAPEANLAEEVGFSISPINDKYRNAAVALELKKVQTKGKVTKYTQMKNGIPIYGTVLTARKNSKGRPSLLFSKHSIPDIGSDKMICEHLKI